MLFCNTWVYYGGECEKPVCSGMQHHVVWYTYSPLFNTVPAYINKIQQYAKACRYLFTAKLLYTFRVPIVLCTPDVGCDGHPKNVE